MKPHSLATVAAFILFHFTPVEADIVYDVIDLGPTYSEARAISASGQIVGYAITTDNHSHATLFNIGGLDDTDLGTLSDGIYIFNEATAINAIGQIVGWANMVEANSNHYHATLFSGTGFGNTDLGTLGGITYNEAGAYSQALAINASGQIVGVSSTSDGWSHATLFSGTGTGNIDLGTLGGRDSDATAINAKGQIVGSSWTTDNEELHATLFSGTGSDNIDLGTLGGSYSYARAINASGQIVGWAYVTGDSASHATRWNLDGTRTDLGTLPQGENSDAKAINASGQIVGHADMPNDYDGRAFLYTVATGMIDLNTLIDPVSDWAIIDATGINDAGQIAGTGTTDGGVTLRAVLLTPRKSTPPTTTNTPTTATPPTAPAVKGKPKIAGNRASFTGKLSTPGSYVEYAVGKPIAKYKKAKATGSSWTATIPLKPGRNLIYLRTVDPTTGLKSTPKKIVIIKK